MLCCLAEQSPGPSGHHSLGLFRGTSSWALRRSVKYACLLSGNSSLIMEAWLCAFEQDLSEGKERQERKMQGKKVGGREEQGFIRDL